MPDACGRLPDPPPDRLDTASAALIDPRARAARLVLALAARQPAALRAEALTMPPERCWTLTQRDRPPRPGHRPGAGVGSARLPAPTRS
jgi:hypothetical protein